HSNALGCLAGGHGLTENGTTEKQQKEFTGKGKGAQRTEGIMLQQRGWQQNAVGNSDYQSTDNRSQKDVHASQCKSDQQNKSRKQPDVSQHMLQFLLYLSGIR